MDDQLLRVLLPSRLLAEIDRQLVNEGSSRTRVDFVQEAIEQRLLELRFGEGPPSARSAETTAATVGRLPQPPLASEEVDLSGEPLLFPKSLADTRLAAPIGATVARPDTAGFPIEPGPYFLHGRDYPSLWALHWLVRWADEGPLDLGDYLKEVTQGAWLFAAQLEQHDRTGPLKGTTMFPTSQRNSDSASQTFQASAIGGLVRRRAGSQVVVGPLALWGAAQIYPLADRVVVAPTQVGLDLLTQLEGLSLELPHEIGHAQVFLSHLREHSPGDYETFITALRAIADDPNRDALIAAMSRTQMASPKSLADVYAQAYVSRGREWGLVEPRLVGRRYRLTERGRAVLAST